MPRTDTILRTAGLMERTHLVVDRLAILNEIKPDVLGAIDDLGWPAMLDPEGVGVSGAPELADGLSQFAEAVHVPDFIVPKVSLLATGHRYFRLVSEGLAVTSAVECALCDTLFRGGSIALGAKAGVALGAIIAGPVGALVGMFSGGFAGGKLGRAASGAVKRAAYQAQFPMEQSDAATGRPDRGSAAAVVRDRCRSACARHALRELGLERAARR